MMNTQIRPIVSFDDGVMRVKRIISKRGKAMIGGSQNVHLVLVLTAKLLFIYIGIIYVNIYEKQPSYALLRRAGEETKG